MTTRRTWEAVCDRCGKRQRDKDRVLSWVTIQALAFDHGGDPNWRRDLCAECFEEVHEQCEPYMNPEHDVNAPDAFRRLEFECDDDRCVCHGNRDFVSRDLYPSGPISAVHGQRFAYDKGCRCDACKLWFDEKGRPRAVDSDMIKHAEHERYEGGFGG